MKAYYIIRPQPALHETIAAAGIDGADLLFGTEIWEGYDHWNSAMQGILDEEAELSRVKLLFLGRLAWDYATENATAEAIASGLKAFVGQLLELQNGLHPSTFDRWWTIERLEGPDFTVADMEREVVGILARYSRKT